MHYDVVSLLVPVDTSILDNHNYNKYTHFEVCFKNWAYRPNRGENFERTRIFCRKHLDRAECAIKNKNHIECCVVSILPSTPICYICKN